MQVGQGVPAETYFPGTMLRRETQAFSEAGELLWTRAGTFPVGLQVVIFTSPFPVSSQSPPSSPSATVKAGDQTNGVLLSTHSIWNMAVWLGRSPCYPITHSARCAVQTFAAMITVQDWLTVNEEDCSG